MSRATFTLALVLLASCSSAPTEPRFVRSCRGEYVDACRPYTYARISEAMLGPEQITIGDPGMRAHVTATFETCGEMTPFPPRIDVSAIIGSGTTPDGGSAVRVVPLVSIPTEAGETSVDVTIDNPFFTDIPEDEDIVLRFTPVIDGCQGDAVEQMYRTGEFASP